MALNIEALGKLLAEQTFADEWRWDEHTEWMVQGGEPTEASLGYNVYYLPADPAYAEACGGTPEAIILADRLNRETAQLIAEGRNALPDLFAGIILLRNLLAASRAELVCETCFNGRGVTTSSGELDECQACRGEHKNPLFVRAIDAALSQHIWDADESRFKAHLAVGLQDHIAETRMTPPANPMSSLDLIRQAQALLAKHQESAARVSPLVADLMAADGRMERKKEKTDAH